MPSGSRRWVAPTVIGVLVLSGLVGLLGWKLGERDARSLEPQVPIGATTGTTAGTTEEACLDPTVQAAHEAGGSGPITLVLYVKTDKAEVWICHDSTGRLFYQGHVGTDPLTEAHSGNSLFLIDVKLDGDTYVATNASGGGTTVYRVNTATLSYSINGAAPTAQAVTSHKP